MKLNVHLNVLHVIECYVVQRKMIIGWPSQWGPTDMRISGVMISYYNLHLPHSNHFVSLCWRLGHQGGRKYLFVLNSSDLTR